MRWKSRNASQSGMLVTIIVLAHLAPASAVAAGEGPAPDSARYETVRVTSSDGLSLFVRLYGSGEVPIILLSGGPGYSGDYLADMAGKFGRHHRVILPDQRGTGRSVINPWDASRVTIEASVSDVEAVRDHSGAEQVIVVGHSWGGVLAMAYAADHADHVRALVLIGSGGTNSAWNLQYSQNLLSRLNKDDIAALFQAQALMASDPEAATVAMIRATAPAMVLDRELALRSADEYSGPEMLTPAVTMAMQGWLQNYRLGAGLREVAAPVLIVQGQHDPIGEETARAIARTFPHSAVHIIPESAHEPFMEQPEAFYAIVEPFLQEQTGAQESE